MTLILPGPSDLISYLYRAAKAFQNKICLSYQNRQHTSTPANLATLAELLVAQLILLLLGAEVLSLPPRVQEGAPRPRLPVPVAVRWLLRRRLGEICRGCVGSSLDRAGH